MPTPRKDYTDISYKAKSPTKVIFFASFAEAKQNAASIREECKKVGQYIVVIREEGLCEDSEILTYGKNIKLFAGRAWSIIFERRIEEEFY